MRSKLRIGPSTVIAVIALLVRARRDSVHGAARDQTARTYETARSRETN